MAAMQATMETPELNAVKEAHGVLEPVNVYVIAMANGGLESFVRPAALDRSGEHRINIVSPPLVRETSIAMGMPEQGPTAAEVALVYLGAIGGEETGSVLEVGS